MYRSNIDLHNVDCLEYMKSCDDNQFDLAIVDPPYFSGPEKRGYYGCKNSPIGVKRVNYKIINDWQLPDINYYNELLRVSKNQIIWGINYFSFCNEVKGRIVWDKVNGTSSFSDCEIASCSFHDSIRMIYYMWNGMMQGKGVLSGKTMQGNKTLNEKRIHPTQKPIKLYEWVLEKYAKKGDLILDTHLGSGSIAIACDNMGFDLVGCELDPHYYEQALNRLEPHRNQQKLF